jgi:alkylglycerol monooxygenase
MNSAVSAPMNVYSVLGPVILGLIVIEFFYCLVKRNGYYSFQDSLISIGTMIISQTFNLLIGIIAFQAYGWIYEQFAITAFPPSPWTYVSCYIGVDFLFYWFHRACHRINILWAGHVTHHAAEELNYAVALRTSFTQRASSMFFYWPLAVVGFSPEVLLPTIALNLVIQFIPHTRVVPRLPKWIHFWINTPYHHQVHHAANPIYWDKNYSGTFIIWDRLFGSYSDQTEPPYYGVAIHPKTWDPTLLTLHWYLHLWRDMKTATHLIDKIKLWFMPPDWRPRNLPPHTKPTGVTAENQIKFRTKAMPYSTPYLLLQLVISFGLGLMVISDHSPFSEMEKIWVSLLLWLGITNWGGILQRRRWVIPAEFSRILLLAGSFAILNPATAVVSAFVGLITVLWFTWLVSVRSAVSPSGSLNR